MKPYTLKKSSWHAWLACHGGLRGNSTDICGYTRAVLWGAAYALSQGLLLVGGLSLAGLATAVVITGAGWLVWSAATLTWQPAWDIVKTGGTVDILLVAVIAWCSMPRVLSWLWEARTPARPNKAKEPGFLKLAYASFKGKFCFKIDLK